VAAPDDEDANGNAAEGGGGIPPAGRPPRLRLDSLARVRFELVRIYREARDGKRDVSDASKLAHILALIGRILEGSDLEKRIAVLEQQARQER
jgi:hypothetical protein